MSLTLIDVAGANFRTSREADRINDRLMSALGVRARYAPARLAIARSLSLPAPPNVEEATEDETNRTIKGDTLFGTGADLGAWVALVVERAEKSDLTKKELQLLISAHWHRGAKILENDWEECGEDLPDFLNRLCETAGLSMGPRRRKRRGEGEKFKPKELVALPIEVKIGEIGIDLETKEPVTWVLNGPGASPHVAIMGAVGSGKTRTARAMLQQIHETCGAPMVAFDLKGDLRDDDRLIDIFDAEVIDVLRTPLPLDVLALPDAEDETEIKMASARFQESFSRVKKGTFGANQMDALREAVQQALRTNTPCSLDNVKQALRTVYTRRQMKPDGAMATFNQLCEFRLFDPDLPPEEFFEQSWIITFPQATEEIRRMVSYLVLDALDRWMNSLADSPTDQSGNRAIRTLCVIDEAHQLLGMRQQALSNLVRMSRSKGGVVMLVSQKPDDFEGEEDDFVGDVGLFASFRTNAKPGAARRVLQQTNLSDLGTGVCIARLGGGHPQYIQAWQTGP
jgi:DNA sulfur modification protein DndE